MLLCLAGCRTAEQAAPSQLESAVSLAPETASPSPTPAPEPAGQAENSQESTLQTGIIPEQVLEGETGEIHYSYYLPEDYDPKRGVPPGDGHARLRHDVVWRGLLRLQFGLARFLCWTQLPEDMIVVSAQLTDWGETSARQAVELTEYFIQHYAVDTNRVYATGYTAGGETMSRAVAMRPDLNVAYLHGASQWDGDFTPVAENGVAVYIFMAENDEYYSSERAREAYNGPPPGLCGRGLVRGGHRQCPADSDAGQRLVRGAGNFWQLPRGRHGGV